MRNEVLQSNYPDIRKIERKERSRELTIGRVVKIEDTASFGKHHNTKKIRKIITPVSYGKVYSINYPEKISLKYKEKICGLLFKDKEVVFQRQIQPFKKELKEHGINNMGVILDLDDVVALTKIGAPGAEAHITPTQINAVPVGAFGWISSVLGGYLTIAGMYFGFDNIRGGHVREKRLKPLLKKSIEFNNNLKKDINSTPQEIKNMEAYTKGIKYSISDSSFQKWISGVTAFSGAANLFASLIFSVFTIPGLALMSIFGLGNTLKNALDLRRANKIDVSILDNIKSDLGKKGKNIFLDRLETKKGFFTKMIPAWSSFSIGSSIVLASSIAGLLGVTFPFGLMIGSAALILAGVIGIIYYNCKHHSMLMPKNENRINRQFLGNNEDILWKIAQNKTNLDLVKEFEKNIYKNFVKEKPGKNIEMFFKRTGAFVANIFTFGIPKVVRDFGKKINNRYYKYLENPELMQKTRNERMTYFEKYVKEKINYYKSLKDNRHLIDESVLKLYRVQKSTCDISSISGEHEALGKINSSLIENQGLLQKLIDEKQEKSLVYDFNVTWDFIHCSKIENKFFENLFKGLIERNEIDKVKKAGYVIEQKNVATGENVITFQKQNFEKALKISEPEAIYLMNYLNRKLDKTIIEDVKQSTGYTFDELSDHLEERIRKSK